MYERIGGLLVTIWSSLLGAYWLFWACLLMVCEIEQLIPRLDREYETLRRWFWEGSPNGSRLLQRLDCGALDAWHRANRPFVCRLTRDVEDLVSAVGRFGFAETQSWAMARIPVGYAGVLSGALGRRWKN